MEHGGRTAYPGARVDVANHFYCYSFEPSNEWSHFFAEQPELQNYFTTVMDKHGLDDHVRWQTEVIAAEWDDEDGMWTITVREPDEGLTTMRARAIITAVGQLNRPYMPEFEGAASFRGPSFHSAEWDHSIDVTGKRVALIGAGASGFQIAPAIADDVEQLTVFQRTAQWMFPNAMYHESVGDGVRWAMDHLPYYGRWYRFLVLWPGSDKGLDAARVDPAYPDQDYAVSEINAAARMMFTDWITNQVDGDQDLLAKVLPDYPATGKRTLQDNGTWLRTLRRDDVDLVRTPIERITPDGVVTADGATHDVDVIVYATGFRHTDVLWPMTITGRDGVDLHQRVGPATVRVSGNHRPGVSELLPRLRAGCSSRPRRQPDLQLRTTDALHQQLPGATWPSRMSTRSNRPPKRRPTGTNAPRPKSSRWCGRTRRSNTPTSKTPTARSTPSARGGSTNTGQRPASPTGRSSS